MFKQGFDNDKYISLQSAKIKERIEMFGDKLYLEFGGKLFDDFHASRVLPGFLPDSKIKMLSQLKEKVEIVLVVSSEDIEKNKLRNDIGITYDIEAIRLIDIFREQGFYVSSVVLTKFASQKPAIQFEKKLQEKDVKIYHHYFIEGYPSNLEKIVSPDGYGRNDYIETTKPLVVVTAPGPGSGKMATCMSQLYYDHQKGIKAGYAKFETFPVWDLPLNHPVNIAYESATADLNDVNMIDPFHLEAYGKIATNYNRDVANFPVLNKMMEIIMGKSPYKSATDMGVNMIGSAIIDNEACEEAAKQEVIRRYLNTLIDVKKGTLPNTVATKIAYLMKKLSVVVEDRKTLKASREITEQTNLPATAIEFLDGRIVTGKTKELLSSGASVLLNALKTLGNIADNIDLISHNLLEPIVDLKQNYLSEKTKKLHANEALIALSVCAVTNPTAKLALDQLGKLKNCELHSTASLETTDERLFKKLGLHITTDPNSSHNFYYY